MNEKLKRCPFCGNKTEIFNRDEDCLDIRCTNFNCILHDGFDNYLGKEDIDAFIKLFNKRIESAWEMFRRLLEKYGYDFFVIFETKYYPNVEEKRFLFLFLENNTDEEAIDIMQEIEKELKSDNLSN